jgi:hypothetical protein
VLPAATHKPTRTRNAFNDDDNIDNFDAAADPGTQPVQTKSHKATPPLAIALQYLQFP